MNSETLENAIKQGESDFKSGSDKNPYTPKQKVKYAGWVQGYTRAMNAEMVPVGSYRGFA